MSKKLGIIIAFLIIAAFVVGGFLLPEESLSNTTGPGVKNTRHDLSLGNSDPSFPWAGAFDTDEVCVFCHTPHGSNPAVNPIWNKSLSGSTFTMYTSSSFDMPPAASLGVPSNLCMSCHDGTMAMNSVINSPGRGTTGSIALLGSYTQLGEIYFPGSPWGYPAPNISGSYSPGNPNVDNLADEHPVSFTYNITVDQEGNNFPAAASGVITGATGARYRLYGNSNDQFECSTCHDVHDSVAYPTKNVSEVFFLRTSNVGSAMCRDCHRNK